MERFYLAALQLAGGVGLAGAKRLLEHFGTAEAAWRAPAAALAACLQAPAAASLGQLRRERPSLHEEIAADCQRKKVALCIQTDAEYPPLLKQIFNPPLVLFYRGTLQPEAHRLAIVGSRRFSPYGKSVAEALAMELARSGATVVSGAARGIDSAAHRGALQTGRTVAVLGCGVDVAYPPENRKLLDEIAEAGAVISEYVPGTQPLPVFFPTRNRIISGLAHGTVVVEAAERSGTSITAGYAHDQGRDVFAIAGRIGDEMSAGPNGMIARGEAKAVFSPEDILAEYSCLHVAAETLPPANIVLLSSLPEDQRAICRLLKSGEMSFDEICDALPLPIGTLNANLTELQFSGIVLALPGRRYGIDTSRTRLKDI